MFSGVAQSSKQRTSDLDITGFRPLATTGHTRYVQRCYLLAQIS